MLNGTLTQTPKRVTINQKGVMMVEATTDKEKLRVFSLQTEHELEEFKHSAIHIVHSSKTIQEATIKIHKDLPIQKPGFFYSIDEDESDVHTWNILISLEGVSITKICCKRLISQSGDLHDCSS
jgi:hypothetical protein